MIMDKKLSNLDRYITTSNITLMGEVTEGMAKGMRKVMTKGIIVHLSS